MALNRELVGRKYPPFTTEVTLEAAQRYARACNDDNPAYFHPEPGTAIIAPPMFGVVVGWGAVLAAVGDPELKADLLHLLHGEQDMEFSHAIRPGDTISAVSRILSIESRPTGETLEIAIECRNQRGELVQRSLFGAFIRGRGRNRDAAVPARSPAPDRGAPQFVARQTIDPDQTFRYAEASGDRNPIHVDDAVARMAGLPGIVVHGLCTMAFIARGSIDRLCGRDPTRLKRLRVRFSRPVLPGQTLTTNWWTAGEHEGRRRFVFETVNPDGHAVIKDGLAEVL